MWAKKGILFKVNDHQNEFIKSHASIPFAYHIKENHFRIYFSSRNENGKSLPYFIDSIISNGVIKLIGTIKGPLLDFGKLGSFDDSGIMPSCIVKKGHITYMYYIGWNPQVTVSYRLSIGLAISYDGGLNFKRYCEGPICDRSINEPYFNTAPFVLFDEGKWKMWYISCTSWEIINNYPEPSYHIKYAESDDGINWNQQSVVCIDYDEQAKALGRPSVLKQNDTYEMYFSYRKIDKYRVSANSGYKIGMALSSDGINWEKAYNKTGIGLSKLGWDSLMMEYCHVFEHCGIQYMLYNGNDFGKDGFGYATK